MVKEEAYILKIMEETGLTRKEIAEKVQEKREELQGLISDEGALFIIGKELGIDFKAPYKNGGNIMEEKNEKKPWYEEAKEAPIAGGIFLPVAYGFEYLLQFEDINDPRNDQEVNKKDMQGNDTVKYWYYVILVAVRGKSSVIEALVEEGLLKQEKVDRIKSLDKKTEFLLELPKTARKDFGKFIAEEQLKNGETFTMKRSGKGGQTKYLFSKINKEE